MKLRKKKSNNPFFKEREGGRGGWGHEKPISMGVA